MLRSAGLRLSRAALETGRRGVRIKDGPAPPRSQTTIRDILRPMYPRPAPVFNDYVNSARQIPQYRGPRPPPPDPMPIERQFSELAPQQEAVGDAPLEPVDRFEPYAPPRPQCFLCRHPEISVDYKNSRLLSQFVSSFTGRLYPRNVTRLCRRQQWRVADAIALSRSAALMPALVKDPCFLRDPKLFDPLRAGPPIPTFPTRGQLPDDDV